MSPIRSPIGKRNGQDQQRRARVLLIDDEELILRSLARLLGRRYEVVISDGSDARALLEASANLDFILCDVAMPAVDGPGLLAHVERVAPHLVPRMFFGSGGQLSPRHESFFEAYEHRILLKPYDIETIFQLVARTVSGDS